MNKIEQWMQQSDRSEFSIGLDRMEQEAVSLLGRPDNAIRFSCDRNHGRGSTIAFCVNC